jgi:FKBP-type peptidyl-prolyl cis-trans isomerase (trigger factor)
MIKELNSNFRAVVQDNIRLALISEKVMQCHAPSADAEKVETEVSETSSN